MTDFASLLRALSDGGGDYAVLLPHTLEVDMFGFEWPPARVCPAE